MADYSGPVSSMMALVGDMYNAALQTETNEYNMENQWKMFGAQNARQDQLNINQALTQRQSLAKAGMNVNSEFGGSPATTPPPVSSATAVAPHLDVSSIANLLLQAPLVKAQARSLNADAEGKEIDNRRESSYDDAIDNAIHQYMDENPTDDDFIVTSGKQTYNKGLYLAKKDWREYQSKIKELDTQDSLNALNKVIYDEQLKDSKVIQALKELPYHQVRKLSEEITNLAKDREVMDSVIALNGSQKELNEANRDWVKFRKEIEEKTNLANMISNLASGDVSAEDVVKIILLGLLKSVGAFNVSLGL